MDDMNRQLIEAYLTHRLSDEQKDEFDKRYKEDELFATALEEEKIIFSTIQDQPSLDFIRKTGEVMAGNQFRSSRPARRNRTFFFIAACAVFLLGIYLFVKPDHDPQNLYDQFFEPYPMVLSQRGLGEDRSAVLIEAYNQGDWVKVEHEISDLSPGELPEALKELYLAIAFLEQNKSTEAIDLLTKYKDNPTDPLYQNILQWYLAIAYLKSGDLSSVNDILSELSTRNISIRMKEKINNLLEKL